MSFKDFLASDRRLCVLRLLKESGGSLNDSVLHKGLEQLGHRNQARETIRADLRFLVDAGLIVDEWVSHIQVVTITKRGVEVAEGRITVEGVTQPSIGV